MKPGKSIATTGVLPSLRARACTVWKVASSVAMPRTNSTSCIIGTGFMKCMPMNLSGRPEAVASMVIEIDEVFVSISASGGKLFPT